MGLPAYPLAENTELSSRRTRHAAPRIQQVQVQNFIYTSRTERIYVQHASMPVSNLECETGNETDSTIGYKKRRMTLK